MKYLKRFNESISIYDPKWELLLPDTITIYKGQDSGIDKLIYTKGNIMLNADMIQITYDIDRWETPDTLEIDIYLVKDGSEEPIGDLTTVVKSGKRDYDRDIKSIKNLRLDVDITFGDEMASEFTISRKGVKLIQHTTYGSKFDPSNTIFAVEDESLNKLVEFFNRFNHGVKTNIKDFYFLRNK